MYNSLNNITDANNTLVYYRLNSEQYNELTTSLESKERSVTNYIDKIQSPIKKASKVIQEFKPKNNSSVLALPIVHTPQKRDTEADDEINIKIFDFIQKYELLAENLTFDSGGWDYDDIIQFIQKHLNNESDEQKIEINCEEYTQKIRVDVLKNFILDFLRSKITNLLGISSKFYYAPFRAEKAVSITQITCINVHCDIVAQSYINGESSHLLHSFALDFPYGYQIIEYPKNIIYLPINITNISSISIKVTDQNNNLLNFNGEEITILIHIKEDN